MDSNDPALDSDQIKTKKIPFRQIKDDVFAGESLDHQFDQMGMDHPFQSNGEMHVKYMSHTINKVMGEED